MSMASRMFSRRAHTASAHGCTGCSRGRRRQHMCTCATQHCARDAEPRPITPRASCSTRSVRATPRVIHARTRSARGPPRHGRRPLTAPRPHGPRALVHRIAGSSRPLNRARLPHDAWAHGPPCTLATMHACTPAQRAHGHGRSSAQRRARHSAHTARPCTARRSGGGRSIGAAHGGHVHAPRTSYRFARTAPAHGCTECSRGPAPGLSTRAPVPPSSAPETLSLDPSPPACVLQHPRSDGPPVRSTRSSGGVGGRPPRPAGRIRRQ
jgi:hypothetical protein